MPTELLEKWQQLYKQPDSVRHFEIDCLVWLKDGVKESMAELYGDRRVAER